MTTIRKWSILSSAMLYVWLLISSSAVMFLLHRSKNDGVTKQFYIGEINFTAARWTDYLMRSKFWNAWSKKAEVKTFQDISPWLSFLHFDSDPNIPHVDCEKIFSGDEAEILKASLLNLELMRSKENESIRKKILNSEWLLQAVRNCTTFRRTRKYIPKSLSAEEKAFPIAYIITIHRDLPAFERLLRSIYHPQNVYCIHPDLKSDEEFHVGVKAVSACFDNVFIASNLSSIQYSHISRVEADVNCMKDLVTWSRRKYPWRYVINLCGQDFPLKTNLEMVRHLKSLGGYNNLETFHTPQGKKRRYEYHFDLPKNGGGHSVMERTEQTKSEPPGKTEMFAGSAYYIFKRAAVEYLITDPLIRQLLEWSKDAYSPDEFLWATFQRLYPKFPGSFPKHSKYDLNELVSVTRLVKWAGLDKDVYPKCSGIYSRGICVYGSGDLPWLVQHKHFFANKFDPSIDVIAIDCLDNFVRNKTLRQLLIYDKLGYI